MCCPAPVKVNRIQKCHYTDQLNMICIHIITLKPYLSFKIYKNEYIFTFV